MLISNLQNLGYEDLPAFDPIESGVNDQLAIACMGVISPLLPEFAESCKGMFGMLLPSLKPTSKAVDMATMKCENLVAIQPRIALFHPISKNFPMVKPEYRVLRLNDNMDNLIPVGESYMGPFLRVKKLSDGEYNASIKFMENKVLPNLSKQFQFAGKYRNKSWNQPDFFVLDKIVCYNPEP